MRIISGRNKGRTLRPPKNLPVRPTTDKAKEGLFNILNNSLDFDGLTVLDLFCGTGNIGFEFASRGAKQVTSVDQDFKCCEFVRSTFKQLGHENAVVIRSEAMRFLSSSNHRWDLVFVDPPYDYDQYEQLVSVLFERNLINSGGILIVEHPAEVELSAMKHYERTRNYGRVHFSFFELEP